MHAPAAAPDQPRRRVAIVIVTYQARAYLERCIGSLISRRCDLKIIVVDNASTDGTAELVAGWFPDVQVIRSASNLGFGAGNNLGIRAALAWSAEHVFLFNQDAYACSGAIDEMADFLDRHPQVGVCSPLHCSPDESRIDRKTLQYYLVPHAGQFISDALLGRSMPSYAVRGVNAAAWYLRAELLQQHGGFDPLFFMYAEDDDLLDRWERHGVRFMLLTGPRIVHLRESAAGPAGWGADFRRRMARVRSRLVLQMKRAAAREQPMWRAAIRLGVVDAVLTFVADWRVKDLAASLAATAAVLGESDRIRRHARLCREHGAHFLNG